MGVIAIPCVFLFLAFNQGEKSKQPCKRGEGQTDQPSERETPEDMLSLVAEVKELRETVSERERQQKEGERRQKQLIEEWQQMKLQLQHVLNTKESKYHVAYIIDKWCLKKFFTSKCARSIFPVKLLVSLLLFLLLIYLFIYFFKRGGGVGNCFFLFSLVYQGAMRFTFIIFKIHARATKAGSDAVLLMSRIEFEFRPTQINLDRLN